MTAETFSRTDPRDAEVSFDAEQHPSEQDLLRQAREGDAGALGRLYMRYADMVNGIALRYVGPDDAADIAQEVYIKVHSRLESYDGKGFGGWLAAIARNTSLDSLRRRKSRPVTIGGDDGRDIVEFTASTAIGPEQLALESDTSYITEALGKISPDQARAIVDTGIHGLSHKEHAERYDIEPITVRSRVYRGRVAMRRLIEVDATP